MLTLWISMDSTRTIINQYGWGRGEPSDSLDHLYPLNFDNVTFPGIAIRGYALLEFKDNVLWSVFWRPGVRRVEKSRNLTVEETKSVVHWAFTRFGAPKETRVTRFSPPEDQKYVSLDTTYAWTDSTHYGQARIDLGYVVSNKRPGAFLTFEMRYSDSSKTAAK